MDNPQHNLLGVDWFGLVMGLGFVPFGYWCTDFLVIQRAMAANSMASARRVPLIASVPKMLFPFLVILPGLLALALMNPVKQNPASTDQPNQSVQSVEIQPDKQGMIPPQTNLSGMLLASDGSLPVMQQTRRLRHIQLLAPLQGI